MSETSENPPSDPARDAYGLMIERRLSVLGDDESPCVAALVDAANVLAITLFGALDNPSDIARARSIAVEMIDKLTIPTLRSMCDNFRAAEMKQGKRLC